MRPTPGTTASDGRVARGYDRVAPDYDRLTGEDAWMRRVLWDHYRRLFRPGDRVLDLGCGTGQDTLFLARLGVAVTALDVSSGMLAALEARLAAEAGEAAGRVETRQGDAAELALWPQGGYDGVVSAFAGLNALPDLAVAARGIAHVLRPGGRAVLHLLARAGLWERLPLLATLRWRGARRLATRPQLVAEIGGERVAHRLYRAAEAERLVDPWLEVRSVYAVGFLWPRRAGRWLPRAPAHVLGRVEARWGRRRPWLDWGRFLVLDLEKRGLESTRKLQ